MGQGDDKVMIPQERSGRGLPEATPAAVNKVDVVPDRILAGARMLGGVLQVPSLGAESWV